MFPEPRNHKGFAIVSAIFILVVLAALGGFIATVSTSQHAGSALDLMGARAYQAARAGIEWGVVKTKTPSFCATSPVNNIGAINNISITVHCNSVASGDSLEAGLNSIFEITAIACSLPSGTGSCPGNAGAPNYVERRLTALVEQ